MNSASEPLNGTFGPGKLYVSTQTEQVVLYIRSSLVMALLLLQQQPRPQPPTKWHVMFLCFLYSLPFGSNKLLCGPY